MLYRVLLYLLFSLCFYNQAKTQACTTLGQTPQTAFPVCGLDTFKQTTVPYCNGNTIPVKGCSDNASYSDKNPYWYKFTCYKSGTLDFTITPNKTDEDYDWQIFDVTGHDVSEVYTNPDLFVVANWSGTYGVTGTSESAATDVQCASDPRDNVPTLSTPPNLIEGHQYLLMVSHFTNAPNGYSLAFNGGTASITDPLTPAIQSADIECNATTVTIKLNKRMKCSSLATDGSDFTMGSNTEQPVSAAGVGCNSGFDMDSLTVTLNKPLQSGTYSIFVKKGKDGNTLLDICNNAIPEGDSATFTTKHSVSAKFNYNVLYGCKTDTIVCTHDGNNNTIVWQWSFTDGYTRNTQNAVVFYNDYGDKQINLVVSNGICSDSAVATAKLDNQLQAAFNLSTPFLCPDDKETFTDTSTGNITNWKWNFANGNVSSIKTPPDQTYPSTGRNSDYIASLVVQNNNNCFDTAYKSIKVLYNCYIAVPSAFTPNGDGKNDYLYPLNAYKAVDLDFKVYNRYGQLIFSTKDWTQKWDGTINGNPQPSGVYVWMLSYTHIDTKQKYFLKGTTVLIR